MSIALQELRFSARLGGDVLTDVAQIEFDPAAYQTPGDAAQAFYAAIRPVIAGYDDQDPDIESFIQTPEQSEADGYGRNWRVCWEAGPWEWAIAVSAELHNVRDGGGWYTEPHYSFDLCFQAV